MNKEQVDKIIVNYIKKIYKFALSKTMNIDDAEELSSRITFEAYTALLKADDIHNVNSYIYRIARNVYACFVIEKKSDRLILSQEAPIQCDNDHRQDVDSTRIRSEITYLSNLHREIVVMYYYEKLKLEEIATRLNIPRGTVKWHLFEARNQIKDGFKKDSEVKTNPEQISFTEMKFIGTLSPQRIDMSFYFNKSLTQNIAYSAYHTAKTSKEISKEIGIPVVFVEDEIERLVGNGFLCNVQGNKYQTNIYIIESMKEIEEKINKIYSKYAKIVCDIYIPLLFKVMKSFLNSSKRGKSKITSSPSSKIYIPKNDENFLMWSIVSFACSRKLALIDKNKAFNVKRRDGGDNIARAVVRNDHNEMQVSKSMKKDDSNLTKRFYGKNFDRVFRSSSKDIYSIKTWQFFSQYDDRNEELSNWSHKLFEVLDDFIIGKLTKEPANIDKFINLYNDGLVVSEGDSEYVNVIITSLSEVELEAIFPSIPERLMLIGKKLDDELGKVNKKYVPHHIRDVRLAVNQNSLANGIMRVYILEYLLSKGILKPLKKHQHKTVNMIVFSDVLPENK